MSGSACALLPEPLADAMLLYIHVPFCRKKCHYCAFASQVESGQDMADWLEALEAEITMWGDRLGRVTFSSLYIGGGTPSLLSPAAVERIFSGLRARFSFPAGCEITFEANPDSVSPALLRRLRHLGVNRLSLGVQSFDDRQLRALGRLHTAEQAALACDQARTAGFSNLSLDLIWGLPGQSLRQWLSFLKTAVSLGPQHLSCYGLTLEPGTRLARQVETGGLTLPTEDETARMFVQGGDLLESCGYMQYEISGYARMGYQSRHNSGYWQQTDYLGLGPGATSTLRGRRWTNPADLASYAQQVKTGSLGQDMEIIDNQTALREMVMLALRTSQGLDLARYRQLAGQGFCRRFQAQLRSLRSRGLIRLTRDHLRLTRTGMLVSDPIIACFLD